MEFSVIFSIPSTLTILITKCVTMELFFRNVARFELSDALTRTPNPLAVHASATAVSDIPSLVAPTIVASNFSLDPPHQQT